MEIRRGVVRAAKGSKLSCKGWQQEAALRMLMNCLDPDVAESPEELVVYAGRAKAARTWKDYDITVQVLRSLENDETLVIQSGKPVGVFKTFEDAPRVLMVWSFIVPEYATHERFRKLQEKGLTAFGSHAAASWNFCGAQGGIEGAYETLAEVARQSLRLNSLKGKLVLTSGLGGAGKSQPMAITMHEGVGIIIEVDKDKIEHCTHSGIGFLDTWTDNLDEALKMSQEARQKGVPLSIGLLGNAADIYPEFVKRGIIPDIVTEQTSAHDELYGYVPAGVRLDEALSLRESDPDRYIKMSYESMVKQVQAMNDLQKMGAVVFDYGTWIRRQAQRAGLENAYQFPGFIDAYLRSSFCKGGVPLKVVALSGDPQDIDRIDETLVKLFPRLEKWIRMAQQRVPFQGLPTRMCRLVHGEQAEAGFYVNELVQKGEVKAPIVITRGFLSGGSAASPGDQTENMKDGSDVIGDWPILKGLLNVASGASWVLIQSTQEMISSGLAVVADGTEKAKERLEKSLTADTGLGVTRLADAGYELARQTIKGKNLNALVI